MALSSSIRITKLNDTRRTVNLRSNTSWINPYKGDNWDLVTGTQYDANTDGNTAAYATGSTPVTFIGSADPNTFSGGNGNDTMNGGDGNDFLFGNNGNDRLRGENGNDFLVGGNGNDYEIGGAGDDLMFGDTRTEQNGQILDSGTGNDTLEGGSGVDTLYGGNGDDTLYGDAASGETNRDASDVLFGGLGNDKLYGRGGNDWLDGGNINQVGKAGVPLSSDGNDWLDGGSGDDTLRGGSGIDTLTGGAGNDTFVFLKGDAPSGTNSDTITDFELGKDAIFLDYIPGNVTTSKPLVITATEAADKKGVLLAFDYKTGQGTDPIDYQIFLKYTSTLTSDSLFGSDGKLKTDTINKMVWTANLSGIQYS